MRTIKTQRVSAPWTKVELKELIKVYFEILHKHLMDPSKVEVQLLNNFLSEFPNRSMATVENGFCQVSTVLSKHNLPYLSGFDPTARFTNLLEHFVIDYIDNHAEIDNQFLNFCIWSPKTEIKIPAADLLSSCPDPSNPAITSQSDHHFAKPNYLEIEQKISVLKKAGERLVIAFETWRLELEGKGHLVQHIQSSSQQGNSDLGYDVLSKNADGTNRYISVKTTKLGKYTPFVFSQQERSSALKHTDHYFTYRVFDLASHPQIFIAEGPQEENAHVNPIVYQASF